MLQPSIHGQRDRLPSLTGTDTLIPRLQQDFLSLSASLCAASSGQATKTDTCSLKGMNCRFIRRCRNVLFRNFPYQNVVCPRALR